MTHILDHFTGACGEVPHQILAYTYLAVLAIYFTRRYYKKIQYLRNEAGRRL